MDEKKGLMVQFPFARGREYVCKNIGDYIQAVATRQFIDNIDEYIEQEEANNYYPEDNKKIRLVMNGWFQWRAENWPPSEYIHPLLISMHISPLKKDELLTPKGIEFLKKNGPVGCRDLYTMHILNENGIDAYFSGCMTLTLGKNYKVEKEKREGVYIVDPFFEIPDIEALVNSSNPEDYKVIIDVCRFYLANKEKIDLLAKKMFFEQYSPTGFLDRDDSEYRRIYKATLFYKLYSKKFDDELLLNAEYITHFIDVKMDGSEDNDSLLEKAENLIKKYASAKLVITSRIHAGLPCLGLETPVIFISSDDVESKVFKFNTPGRLDGLLDLFRVFYIREEEFETEDEELETLNLISENTIINNKKEWEALAESLTKKVENFMK